MPSWEELIQRVQSQSTTPTQLTREYLAKFHESTGRNVIAYYSGWLHHAAVPNQELQSQFAALDSISDTDMNGFMTTVHGMEDRSKGLDLILHTPGGDIAATEAIVRYLYSIFGKDIRVIVPQLAMSAGTMIACASREILLGKQSSLGPIDPQLRGLPAHFVYSEFHSAREEILKDPASSEFWKHILAKYPPTFLDQCYAAIQWSEKLVRSWLVENMFESEDNPDVCAEMVVKILGDAHNQHSHSRHVSPEECLGMGLNVTMMEDDQEIQDLVLSIHHSFMIAIANSSACKIIQNHLGTAHFVNANA